jgi:hypothetical protein
MRIAPKPRRWTVMSAIVTVDGIGRLVGMRAGEDATDQAALVDEGRSGAQTGFGRLTIHWTPKRSVHMPK